jgi:hypothetical protein
LLGVQVQRETEDRALLRWSRIEGPAAVKLVLDAIGRGPELESSMCEELLGLERVA